MTEPGGVTVADTVRWLHEEGLIRLTGVAERIPDPIVAYTIEVATGTVAVHPATGVGLGSDVTTLAADDLPHPVGTPKRLVIVGITTAEAVLVIDLAAVLLMAINADRPETVARSWVMQLLLNSEITLTTNSADVVIGDSPRCKHGFIPGGGASIISVDDTRPPVTTITLNPVNEGPDHLDLIEDGTGEMYLGARFWQLNQVMSIDDVAWTALASTLEAADPENGKQFSESSR